VGFVAGAFIARTTSGFWPAQGLSLAAVLVVSLLIGFVGRMYGEVAPELDGDQLMLQVEVKFPRGWQPDTEAQKPEGRGCLLRPMGPGQRMGSPGIGGVDWQKAGEIDGQWVMPCSLRLFSSRPTRFVSLTLGKTSVQFELPLPVQPSNKDKEWSQWSSQGFSPDATDYAFRYRVKGVGEIRQADAKAQNNFSEEREKAAAAIPVDAPVAEWLPLFEDPGETPAVYRWGGAERKERKAVAAKVLELGPLLESNDPVVTRRAVFALGSLSETPEALVEPLLAAGRRGVELIKKASDGTDREAGERASLFFSMWNLAARNAGPAQAARFRGVREQMEREARASKGDLGSIVQQVREDLAKN
jgi:hypothetical protein